MNTYLKFKSPWFQLLIFATLAIGVSVVLLILSALVVSKIYGLTINDLTAMDLSNPTVLSANKVLQAISSIVVFLLPSLLFAYLSDKRPLKYIGFRKPMPPVFWLIAILLIFVSLPAVGWLGNLNEQMHLPAGMESAEKAMRDAETANSKIIGKFLEMKTPLDLFSMLFVVALLPAIGEELFFRGVVQRLFIQITKRPWVGIIFTGIIFSAFHQQYFGFFPRMVLGILLGALFWFSGSLWPCILAHFVFNGSQVIMVYFNPSFADAKTASPVFPVGLVVGSVFLVCLLLAWMTRISHVHYATVYDTDDDDFTIENTPDQPE